MWIPNTLPLKPDGKMTNLLPERPGANKKATLTPNLRGAFMCNGQMGAKCATVCPQMPLLHPLRPNACLIFSSLWSVMQTKFVCNTKNFVWIMTNFVCRSIETSTATYGSRTNSRSCMVCQEAKTICTVLDWVCNGQTPRRRLRGRQPPTTSRHPRQRLSGLSICQRNSLRSCPSSSITSCPRPPSSHWTQAGDPSPPEIRRGL